MLKKPKQKKVLMCECLKCCEFQDIPATTEGFFIPLAACLVPDATEKLVGGETDVPQTFW
jgi:hypothetical protein